MAQIIIIEPDDILVFKDVGYEYTTRDAEPVFQFFKSYGVRTIFFSDDIDICKMTPAEIAALREALDAARQEDSDSSR